MRDKDTIILENLYVSILEEDAASSKAQALNFFVQNEVGREIFKYKNKPDNKEIIEKAKSKWNPTIDQLEKIILDNNPKDKNLADIIPLAKFVSEVKDIELIRREYTDYVSHPSLLNQKTIQKAPNFTKWAEEIHSKASESAEKEESNVLGTKDDPNKVYEDENIIVFLANNPEDPRKSLANCKKYGRGTTLCISGPSAKHYYNDYRWNDKLTTYFIWLKKENRYILVDANEDGTFQYNNVMNNNDISATPDIITSKYPDLAPAFQQGIFKSVPITGKEEEFYQKFFEADSPFEFDTIEDQVSYVSFHDLTEDQWAIYERGGEEWAQPILQTAIESSESDIPHSILEKFPPLKKRYWAKKKQNVEREMAEWDENDEIEFTPDEISCIVSIGLENLPENFIDMVSNISRDSKKFLLLLIENIPNLKTEDLPEKLMSNLGSFDILSVFVAIIGADMDIPDKYLKIFAEHPDSALLIGDALYKKYGEIPKILEDSILKQPSTSVRWVIWLLRFEDAYEYKKYNNLGEIDKRFLDSIATSPESTMTFFRKLLEKDRLFDLRYIPPRMLDTLYKSGYLGDLTRAFIENQTTIPEEFLNHLAHKSKPLEVYDYILNHINHYSSFKGIDEIFFDRLTDRSEDFCLRLAERYLRVSEGENPNMREIPDIFIDRIAQSSGDSYELITKFDQSFNGQWDGIDDRILKSAVEDSWALDQIAKMYIRKFKKFPETIIDALKDKPVRVSHLIGEIETQNNRYKEHPKNQIKIDPRLIEIIASEPEVALQHGIQHYHTFGEKIPDILVKSIESDKYYSRLYHEILDQKEKKVEESVSFKSFFYRKIP